LAPEKDPPKTDPDKPDPDKPDDENEAQWGELEKRVRSATRAELDEWFDAKIKDAKKSGKSGALEIDFGPLGRIFGIGVKQ